MPGAGITNHIERVYPEYIGKNFRAQKLIRNGISYAVNFLHWNAEK